MGVELGSTETALDLEAALNNLGLKNPEGEDDEHDDDEPSPDGERRQTVLHERDP
jgi:hypothetical protein